MMIEQQITMKVKESKKMGGIIFWKRVFGNLTLTRAFCDNEFKQYRIICNPHITKNEINIDDNYIVLASDVVWDVMDEKEIFELSKECKNSKEFCDMIVKNSLIKGSMDYISCFVILLNYYKNHNTPLLYIRIFLNGFLNLNL